MKSTILTIALLLVTAVVVRAEPKKPKESEAKESSSKRISLEGLVTSETLPKGYELSRLADIVQAGKTLGSKLLVFNKDKVSKVMISKESRKIESRAARIAACKGYVNGVAQTLASGGLKIVNQKLFDLKTADFTKRQIAELTFEKPDGSKFFVQFQILFTDTGYSIVVIADNKEDLEMLAKWAKSVQPEEAKRGPDEAAE